MPATPHFQLSPSHLEPSRLEPSRLEPSRLEVVRDDVGEPSRHATAAPRAIPEQRDRGGDLSDREREAYERQLDAYEVQLQEYRRRLHDMSSQLQAAHHDGLTGAWLRTAGQRLLQQELHRAARTDMPLSIAFVDVDGLKRLNDTEGHAAGDHALATVGRVLLTALRSYDHVVRWGGDEFLCLLPGVARAEAARRLRHVQQVVALSAEGLTVSVGVAEWHAGEDAAAVVTRADQALYLSRGPRRRS